MIEMAIVGKSLMGLSWVGAFVFAWLINSRCNRIEEETDGLRQLRRRIEAVLDKGDGSSSECTLIRSPRTGNLYPVRKDPFVTSPRYLTKAPRSEDWL